MTDQEKHERIEYLQNKLIQITYDTQIKEQEIREMYYEIQRLKQEIGYHD